MSKEAESYMVEWSSKGERVKSEFISDLESAEDFAKHKAAVEADDGVSIVYKLAPFKGVTVNVTWEILEK